MTIIYDSLTGQTKRFAQNLGFPAIHVKLYEGTPEGELFLVTRSINFGKIPQTTKDFLDQYKDKVIGVAVSGNKNWGENYGKAGDSIEAYYNIPLILKFEGSGFKSDRQRVMDWLIKQEEGKKV
ncbi:class Ib ribonucleoside-diphosphate reductase assembly flavoprotein NrdI [Acholeplasma granularum]|uniref:class Ib ribonucleoside-diphosphate reductase assembly flavoprotein NrdI n=1 Tax=Acholeplasma granularum TaxID=264635 RepID=UPI00046E8584|nr:class Ib ribonucleoside-diphosphate reductase assembly flavoprotein NrdI [Acholeplasma granularum]